MNTITIDNSSDSHQRLDKFLKKFLPNAPLGVIYKLLRTGKIKISGTKKDQTYRLNEGDIIEFFLTPEEIKNFQKKEDKISLNVNLNSKKPRLDIIYQDEDLLVINKPAGMNVHPWDYKTKEISLIDLVHDYLWKKYNSLTFKPSLVHRIDRDTSGCILIALKKNILEKLLSELQNHKIEKIYHTIVVGKMSKPRGTITDKLLRKESAKDEAKVVVSEDGQRAITHYRTLKEFKKDENIFSLLECCIETGRTHQIRVHLSHNNCPILWDKAYGNKNINAFARRKYQISRQLLHAFSLEFFHPWIKKRMKVEAPYKADFQKFFYEKKCYYS